jgi:aldehyde:ferredoxin oxidoreductase
MAERYGYTGKILWIDLADRSSRFIEFDEHYWRIFVGSGLLGTKLLLDHTVPGLDAFDPECLLIFASSVVAGHLGPGLARFAVISKSPLTNGIGEARTEGPFGTALKGSGADAIVIVGKSDVPATVVVRSGGVSFQDARDLWGMNTGEAVNELERKHGRGIHTAVIGPAGENLVRFASIVTDRTFQVQRMGLGAVMGAKHLKALVVDPGPLPRVHDEIFLESMTNWYQQNMVRNDLTRWQYHPPGFSDWIYLHGIDAALCVNNYSKSTFDQVEELSTERFLSNRIQALTCPGCPNDCIKSIHPADATDLDPRSSGIHQEVTGTMGPNIGVGDLSFTLRANNLCNQYGVDPTSLGFTISFAMELFERGVLKKGRNADRHVNFGDQKGAHALLEDITFRRGLGDVLAEGTKRAAQKFGEVSERYAMHVKGLEMVPFEPRSQTNLALGYAVAAVGPRYEICEHDWDFDLSVGWGHTLELSRTVGILERIPMQYLGVDKVRNFKALLNLWSAADSYLMCIFAVAPTRLLSLKKMAGIVEAITGWETSSYELMRTGERRNHIMRWYNHREGLTREDDRLPERFYTEPIMMGPRAGDFLDRRKFEECIHDFYLMMGWDDFGVPTRQTMYDHHLESVINQRHER